MGAGKSTKSRQVAAETNAVLISEDEWLERLFPGEISTFNDYLLFSKRLKPLLESHVEKLLKAGTNVVLDFPANTRKQRDWFRLLISKAESPYEFYYIKATDELCLKQIAQRQVEQPERAHFDTAAVFHLVSEYFESPDESEGFVIRYE